MGDLQVILQTYQPIVRALPTRLLSLLQNAPSIVSLSRKEGLATEVPR